MSQQKQIPLLQSFEARLRDRLLRTQDTSGGWAEHPGGTPSPFNTAESILALSVARPANDVGAVQQHIRKGVQFLLMARDREPMPAPDSGAWHRRTTTHEETRLVADVVRTAIAIGALINAGEPADKQSVSSAIDWLLNRQNKTADDSGWAFQRGLRAEVLPTCFALLALIAASLRLERNPGKTPSKTGSNT